MGYADLRAFPLPGEIAFFGGMTIVYKSSIDIFLYVVGSSSENEVNFGDWVTRRVCSGLEVGYENSLLVLPVGLGVEGQPEWVSLQLYTSVGPLGTRNETITPSVGSCCFMLSILEKETPRGALRCPPAQT